MLLYLNFIYLGSPDRYDEIFVITSDDRLLNIFAVSILHLLLKGNISLSMFAKKSIF